MPVLAVPDLRCLLMAGVARVARPIWHDADRRDVPKHCDWMTKCSFEMNYIPLNNFR